MRRMTGCGLILATMVATGASDLLAQQGRRGPRGPGVDGRRAGLEAVMNMRDRLELTDEQFNSLEALRQSNVQNRNDQFASMNELQSQLAAGLIERSQFVEAVRAQRGAARELAQQQREHIETILTEDQVESLREMQGRARAFARGRASANRGPAGVRGQRRAFRGSGPGIRGRGPRDFGPDARGQRFRRGPGEDALDEPFVPTTAP